MQTEARKFNSDGVSAFRRVLNNARFGKKSNQAGLLDEAGLAEILELLFDDRFSEQVVDISLDSGKSFKNRLELGLYLKKCIPENSSAHQYENVGFWSWVSAFYINKILEPGSDQKSFKVWSDYRYIPEASLSKFRYYRHLCYLPYWICKTQPLEIAEFFLIQKTYTGSDVIEQLYTSDKDFLPFPGIIDVAKKLYINPVTNNYRKNFLGKTTPGSARRLANVIVKQWQLNYDLHVLSSDQIWEMLPKEFENWKRISRTA